MTSSALDTLRRTVSPCLALAVFVFVLSGCVTLGPTPEQQSARAAWNRCPKAANIALVSIKPDGVIHYRAVSSQSGGRELAECLTSAGARVSPLVVAAAP